MPGFAIFAAAAQIWQRIHSARVEPQSSYAPDGWELGLGPQSSIELIQSELRRRVVHLVRDEHSGCEMDCVQYSVWLFGQNASPHGAIGLLEVHLVERVVRRVG